MRKLALALTSAFVLALASPALAQTGATARVTAPGDGAVVVGTATVSGSGSATAGVRSIKLFIEGSLVASKEPSDVRQNIDVAYSWSTGSLRNGWYQIRVEVAAVGGATDSAHHNVKVDNAPQAPTGLTGTVREQTISLSWSPNPESDIVGYRVEVANGDTWSLVTETQGTSYAAEVEPGSYQFRVTALRSSPSMDGGHPSDPTAPVSLTVEAPPPTKTGNAAIGGGKSSGRGSFGGGNTDVYGRDGAASTREVKGTSRSFSSGGISFGGISLPGQMGLPSLPGSEPFEWGSYKERLPYSLPQGGIPLDAAPPRLAALSTTTIIPRDALRWVGAGMLLIVLAGLMQFIGWRAAVVERLGPDSAALSRVVPAVNFKDAHVRIRRSQDRIRAAWKKARGS